MAMAGTFGMMGLVALPAGKIGIELRVLSAIIIMAGTVLSSVCAYWLGRSFSIMASARNLVKSGPYSLVRHPLYAAEAFTAIGIVISHWSVAALLLGLVQLAIQFRRMHHEEAVLRANFPEYAAYAAATPMIVPFLRRKPAQG
jgi:protein-S-isoprenylcysteine O-methyltransferase Ste14